MSKSVGNYIGVTDPPGEMFGKAMSIPDHLMPDYYSLLLDRPMPEGEPVANKRELARSLVRTFHGESAVADAEKTFDAVVRREVPEDAPVVELPDVEEIWIVDLITLAGFAATNGEARRFHKGRGRARRRRDRARREGGAENAGARRPGAPGRQAPLRPAGLRKTPEERGLTHRRAVLYFSG